ncbi:MAG: FAD-dependent oxidoreductase [Gammaproteobacteria bacterium]|nr:FAD-dependent oxidoreductase [Gammaproteobacteria bacterium]
MPTGTHQPRHFTVVGAGIVGVCCACALLRDGHRVTLIDRDEPGRGCSYGNGGIIQVGASVPVATPGVLRQVPRMLLDPNGPLVIRWPYLPRLTPYLLRFIASARPDRVERISVAIAALLDGAIGAFREMLGAAGALDAIAATGELYVYQSETAYRAARAAHDLRRRRGVRVEELSADEVRQLVPALAPSVRRGVFLPDCMTATNPFHLTTRLVNAFRRDGGVVLRETLRDIEMASDRRVTLLTGAGRHEVDRLVLATGAWSGRWAAKLGARIPMDTERGYHVMLSDPGIDLRVPVLSGDHRFGITSMVDGIRVAGTAELAGLEAPPNYRRAEMLVPMAEALLPGLRTKPHENWMGHRPSTPDSLPVIARAPRIPDVFFAFGHGHLGLTLGPLTGKLIADLAAGRPPPVDMAPYAAERFQ